MRVSMLPGNQVRVQFSGPLGRMAGGICAGSFGLLEKVFYLRIVAPPDSMDGAGAPAPSCSGCRRDSRMVAIAEMLCQPLLLLVQALVFVLVSAVFLCGLIFWAAWRALCWLVKPALILACVAVLVGVGALGGYAYSEYRQAPLHAAADDLSQPYDARSSTAPGLANPPAAQPPLPPADDLFKTPPAPVPSPLPR